MSTEAGQILDSVAPQAVAPAVDQSTAPPVEGKDTPQAPPAQVKDDRVSSKLEVLIKREREALRLENLAKQKQLELDSDLKRLEEFGRIKSDPLKAIEFLGFTPEQFAQIQTNNGQIPVDVEVQKLKQEIEKLRSERAQDKTELQLAEERRAKEENERIVTSYKSQIGEYLKENESRYEFITFENQQDLVFEVINEHYARTSKDGEEGEILSIQQAADKVEQHLEDRYNRAKKLNKVQTLWGAIPKETQKELAKQTIKPQTPPPQTRTLTNQLSATPSTPRKTPITDEERVKKAIAYANQLGLR